MYRRILKSPAKALPNVHNYHSGLKRSCYRFNREQNGEYRFQTSITTKWIGCSTRCILSIGFDFVQFIVTLSAHRLFSRYGHLKFIYVILMKFVQSLRRALTRATYHVVQSSNVPRENVLYRRNSSNRTGHRVSKFPTEYSSWCL